ncbi:MAG: bifunctional UDP-2,4-diacetamido-2,4,6-trideoxy-beta-L-altropyranose hydrolase/GNAT family N-acetyltransferase [Melioribacteraceae bacterium]
MKVSIVTEGFYNTGYGHLTRCLSIYQAFEERTIFPVFFINGDADCRTMIPETRHDIFDWLKNPEELLSKIAGSDVVIVDSYLAPKELYDRIAAAAVYPIFIDDYLRMDYPPGTVINGSVNAEKLNYPEKLDTTYLLGPKYIPLRKDFWQVRDKPIKSDLQSVLLTFGGQDTANMTPRMLRMLVRNQPELIKKVVVGSGFKNLDLINDAKDERTEIYRAPSSSEMVKIMLESDAAISAAGQTIYELACTGVPTIALSVAENQKNNLQGWIKEGFLTTEFSNETVNLENRLLVVLNNYKKRELRFKLGTIGKKKVDGLGARRIVQSVLDLMINRNGGCYLRIAGENDAMMVFNLSNDRTVRLNSINQDPISWQDHLYWYSDKIKDKNCLFLLAFNGNDEFVGQVRFYIKGVNATISISIDKNFRGKGLSSPLLIKSSFKYLKEHPEIQSILAYIRPANTASIKAFSGAAYVFSNEEIVNGEKFSVYKLARQV